MDHLAIHELVSDLERSGVVLAFIFGADEPNQLWSAVGQSWLSSLILHQLHALVHESAVGKSKGRLDFGSIGVSWNHTSNPFASDDVIWLWVEVVVGTILKDDTDLER